MQADRVSSLILWGPPGCGKTTFALLLGGQGVQDKKRQGGSSSSPPLFKRQSAVTCGVNEIRKVRGEGVMPGGGRRKTTSEVRTAEGDGGLGEKRINECAPVYVTGNEFFCLGLRGELPVDFH